MPFFVVFALFFTDAFLAGELASSRLGRKLCLVATFFVFDFFAADFTAVFFCELFFVK